MIKSKLLGAFVALVAIFTVTSAVAQTPDANGIIYVKKSGVGNGSSWDHAMGELAEVLAMAKTNTTIKEIWVAGGTYKPRYRADNLINTNKTDRANAFLLVKDVKLYGGFAGTETTPAQRDLTITSHKTILSGDFGDNDVITGSGATLSFSGNTENAYHVVVSAGDVGTARLDGFTITGGNANRSDIISINGRLLDNTCGGGMYNSYSSPALANVTIAHNTASSTSAFGGGMYNSNSSPILNNVILSKNLVFGYSATSYVYAYGGGMFNNSSSPVLNNVTISGNKVHGSAPDVHAYGGGICNYTSSPTLINVTVGWNSVIGRIAYGGGMFDFYSSSKIYNSIIWGNKRNDSEIDQGADILTIDAENPILQHSLTQGYSTNDPADNNLVNTDPLFGNVADSDYTLKAGSPAINAGDNRFVTTEKDLAGNPRTRNNRTDMGAYEFQVDNTIPVTIPDANGILYIKKGATGRGNSWENALGEIADALAAAKHNTFIKQIWVAGGLYKPSYRADNLINSDPLDRENAFVLVRDVAIYGGFAGTETALAQRDLRTSTNQSILSGDFSDNDVVSKTEGMLSFSGNEENAYHVVISAGDVGAARLDGFTIRGGHANSGSHNISVNGQGLIGLAGGGLYCRNSSPMLMNLTVSNNSASSSSFRTHGGGMSNINSSPQIINVIFKENLTSSVTPGAEGTIYNSSNSSPILTNVSICANGVVSLTGNARGGAIYNSRSSPILTNVTISENMVSGATLIGGAGLLNNSGSEPKIYNSIIWGNTVNGNATTLGADIQDLSNSITTVKHSITQVFSTGNPGDNNLENRDPSFNSAANSEFSLKPSSPAINAGSNVLYDGLDATTIDLAGNLRVNEYPNGTIDLGAYEYQAPRPDANGILYVKTNGAGNFSGDSWDNATGELADGLAVAKINRDIKQIWVAGGTYKPLYRADVMTNSNPLDRDNAFVLVDHVQVYGGFTGNETALAQRVLGTEEHKTILSGDLNGNGENAYHVVIAAGAVGTARLDGFTITGGHADGEGYLMVNGQIVHRTNGGGINNTFASPTLTHLIISENRATAGFSSSAYGGGMSNLSSSPLVSHVQIINNTANSSTSYANGGGIYNMSSSPVFTNVVISGNRVSAYSPFGDVYGGGVCNENSSPIFVNVVVSKNTAYATARPYGAGIANRMSSSPVFTNVTIVDNLLSSPGTAVFGGGIYSVGSSPSIYNSIIWGNLKKGDVDVAGADLEQDGNSPINLSHSITQSYATHIPADHNQINADPLFNDPANNDYSLKKGSPAIHAGSNLHFEPGQIPDLSGITLDLAGNARIQKGVLDIGAYESSYFPNPKPDVNGVVYVKVNGSGNHSGNSWENATGDLQDAIDATGTKQVWVAIGEYQPAANQSFHMKNHVAIFGSFPDSGNPFMEDRTLPSGLPAFGGWGLGSVLKGNGNVVVVNDFPVESPLTNTAVMDGFTITGGYSQRNGGGIFNRYASPTLTNISITGNNTGNTGGGVYNEYSSPTLKNLTIIGNTCSYGGGGISNSYSSPLLTNVIISGNSTFQGGGGGIYNQNSSPILTNIVIRGNSATDIGSGAARGGGIYNLSASPILTNVTISGNTATVVGGILNQNSFPKIYNSLIWGNTHSRNQSNNNYDGGIDAVSQHNFIQGLIAHNGDVALDVNDFFTDAANGDYTLKAGSPAINAGSNTFYAAGQTPDLSGITVDLAGHARIQFGLIDVGAYESDIAPSIKPDVNGIVYVKEIGSGNHSGDSWANATAFLQDAINGMGTKQVWVATGEYRPIDIHGFRMKNDVAIYGGFDPDNGIVALTDKRVLPNNLKNNATSTSSLGSVLKANGNRVIINQFEFSEPLTGTAVLDGFSIKDGNTSGRGAGIFNSYASPTLTNLVISDNTGSYGGGIFNLYSSPVLTNVFISGNTAFSENGGGGLFNIDSSPILTNVTITGNTDHNDSIGGMANFSSSFPMLTNVTVAGNLGDGIHNSDSTPKIYNSLVWGNGSRNYTGDIDINSDRNYIQGLDAHHGNNQLQVADFFTDADNGNYSLKKGSPVINAGNSGLNLTTYDIVGNLRTIGGAIDLGAYESSYQNIASIGSVPAVSMAYGMVLADVQLPVHFAATVTLTDGENASVPLDRNTANWALVLPASGTFNPQKAGTYTFEVPVLPLDPATSPWFTNVNNHRAMVTVTVAKGMANLQALWNGSAISSEGIAMVYGAQGALTVTHSSTATVVYTAAPAESLVDLTDPLQARAIGVGNGKLKISLPATDDFEATSLEINISVSKATLAVAADAGQGKIYGQLDNLLNYTYSGLQNDDPTSILSGVLSRQPGENVGSYAIGSGTLSAGNNYMISFTDANFKIDPAPITITTEAKGKTYGDADPALTYTFTPTLAFSDTFTGSVTRTTGENVGNYVISQGTLRLNSNYVLSYIGANLSITPKALTIAADHKSRLQGVSNPTLTVAYSGFVNGENNTSALDAQPVLATAATIASVEGIYPIAVSGAVAAHGNYTITYVNGTLTVTPGFPTALAFAPITLFENRPAGSLAGRLSSTAPDPNAVFTYTLVSGAGSADNAKFSITGNELLTAASLDFESQAIFTIRVRTTTQYGLSLEQTFTINIQDVNEAPTLNAVADQTVCYTTSVQDIALAGITPGPEAGQTVSMTITTNNPGLFRSLFVTKGNGTVGTFSYGISNGWSGTAIVMITVKDDGGTANDGSDTFTRTFNITVNPLPVLGIVSSVPSNSVSKGESLQLTANAPGAASYSWSNANGIISGQNTASLTIRPTQTTTYTVTAFNVTGCSESKQITTEVRNDFSAVKANNILTPNGDGANDTWIITHIEQYPNAEVKVFDRAGRVVFQRRGYDNSWNGSFNGTPLNEGAYLYVIDFGSGLFKSKGTVTILHNN